MLISSLDDPRQQADIVVVDDSIEGELQLDKDQGIQAARFSTNLDDIQERKQLFSRILNDSADCKLNETHAVDCPPQ